MLVWIAVFAVVIATPIAMPAQQQASATKGKRETQQTSPPCTISTNDSSTHYQQSSRDKPEGWHKLITWPEGITTWAILFTLGAIVWQAIETRKAAQATGRYAEAFIESQRPMIACDAHGNPFQDLADDVPRIRLALSNHGPTTAFHCAHESWIEFIPHEIGNGFAFDGDFTFSKSATYFISENAFSLYPGHSPVIINIPAGRDLSDADKVAIKGARLLVYVRLRLTFSDAFNPKRFSDFGFWVAFDGMRHLAKYQDSN